MKLFIIIFDCLWDGINWYISKKELVQPRIEEIEKYRATILEMIEQIELFDREGLQSFLFDPIQSTTHITDYVRNLKRESVKLTYNLFNIEH